MLAPTYAQIRTIRRVFIIAGALLTAVFICGNIYNTFIKDGISVDPASYTLKNGYPLFVSEKNYIDLVKSYPLDPGVKIAVHNMSDGETLWDVCRRYGVDIDTVIAANPFLTDLDSKNISSVAVPLERGVLFAFDDYFDVRRMTNELEYRGGASGEYKPWILKIISNDDIRLVFFKNTKPVFLNPQIEKLYAYHRIFDTPLDGKYTSMFGARKHPLFNGDDFHNGIDIQSVYGHPIKAARGGIVSFSGWRGGYGKTVMVIHDNGYTTMYAHCSELKVKRGDFVTTNSVVGYVGSTGISTGPHLHFTLMYHNKIIDPLILFW